MALTHTKNTDWADSSGDVPVHDGLTKFGRKIISRMDELSMVIDVSHSSDKTVEDVFEVSSMPIMASHSCARALCDIPRNLSDDLILEIAERKGFIGVNFWPGFLKKSIYDQVMKNIENNLEWYNNKMNGKENNPDAVNKIDMEFYSRMIEGNDDVDLHAVIDHINHIVNIGGIDCVGLGSDFDGMPSTPIDLTDVSCYPALVEGLSDKGFSDIEIKKIMGMNLLNFLEKFDK
jgi:membrane dipeptidase